MDTLAASVWTHYATQSPVLGLFLGVDEAAPDQVIAHSLAFLQLWNGEPVAWVVQFQSDCPMDRASLVAFHVLLDEWIHEYNARNTIKVRRAMLSTPHKEAVYVRWTGWRRYRTLLDRQIPRGADHG